MWKSLEESTQEAAQQVYSTARVHRLHNIKPSIFDGYLNTHEQMLPGMPGHELRKEVGENRTMRNRGKVVTRAGPEV